MKPGKEDDLVLANVASGVFGLFNVQRLLGLQSHRVVRITVEIEYLGAPVVVTQLAAQVADVVLRCHAEGWKRLEALYHSGVPLYFTKEARLLSTAVFVDCLDMRQKIVIC